MKAESIHFFTIDQIGIITYNAVMRGLEADNKRAARKSRGRLVALLKSMGIVAKSEDIAYFGIAIAGASLEKGIVVMLRREADLDNQESDDG